jgi:hypothetical protein
MNLVLPMRVLKDGLALACASSALVLGACSTMDIPTLPSAAPVTETFENQFGVQGAASRSFVVSETGAVSVTLTAAGPPSDVALGIGIGIPRSTGSGCSLSRSVTATAAATPHLTVTAEPGTYCVQVFDVGALTGDVRFSVSVLHP